MGYHQPNDEEEYVSPLVSTFSLMFGSDWVSVKGEKIAHRYSSSYSTARNNEREQRKRKTIAVMALETILAHCLL